MHKQLEFYKNNFMIFTSWPICLTCKEGVVDSEYSSEMLFWIAVPLYECWYLVLQFSVQLVILWLFILAMGLFYFLGKGWMLKLKFRQINAFFLILFKRLKLKCTNARYKYWSARFYILVLTHFFVMTP